MLSWPERTEHRRTKAAAKDRFSDSGEKKGVSSSNGSRGWPRVAALKLSRPNKSTQASSSPPLLFGSGGKFPARKKEPPYNCRGCVIANRNKHG